MNHKSLKEIIKLLPATIIVTGAHFSGTRQVAEILAELKQSRFVPESTESLTDIRDMIVTPKEQIKKEDGKFVNVYEEMIVEMPQYCHMIHHFHQGFGLAGIPVIFVTRNIKDIIQAQRDASWTGEAQQKLNYQTNFPQIGQAAPISMIKREAFFRFQLPARPNTFFFDYDMFKSHPMFKA